MNSGDVFEQQPRPIYGRPLEQQVRELADREEIRDLIATYAHRVAHNLSVADLFADDGAYIHRRTLDAEPEVTRGRAALEALYAPRPNAVGLATPMIHNTLISIDGDGARGVCSIELRIWGSSQIIACGFYRDSFRRENGRWRFFERDNSFFHWGALSAYGQ